ncbi:uncharacterized protein LOC113229710 [Hyposmocoma kahamanoa]|uniref:uncharacterized protein LOC113229710 n=1 Tax=Hyposmocoma kahamanoa TaxID=1477025 RepID=UPI000E6D7371|nr:uncharacterized protein LOC113229710 [Hyposmocoma kahamanoa]
MIRFSLILGLVSICLADLPVTPPAAIRCGQTPNAVYSCLGNPKVVKPDVSQQCTQFVSECEKLKCVFEKSGWLKDNKVDKEKVKNYFDDYAKETPAWAPAVEKVKTECLTQDLVAQGVFVNCPAYDVMHCILTNFLRNAQPSQWSTSATCEYPRQFAAACPVCPEDCFAPQVPYGSCNACRLLPRST